MDNRNTGPRGVLPRWRSLESTPQPELDAINRPRPASSRQVERRLELDSYFAETKSLDDAAELVEASLTLGHSKNTFLAAKLLESSQATPLGLRVLARKILTESTQGKAEAATSIAPVVQTPSEIHRSISQLKRRLAENPRNGLLAIEIARLHFQLSQRESAQRYANRALATHPDSRYILRSATCMFAEAGNAHEALYYLRRSEAFKWDPWIQSAEIAASELTGSATRVPKGKLIGIKGLQTGTQNTTELAASLATSEISSGNRRVGKRLLEVSMQSPNENSLAQLRWLQKNRDVARLVEPANGVPNAFEARTYELIEKDNPGAAAEAAETWLADQPFLSGPALIASSLYLSVLYQPQRAIDVLNRALQSSKDNVQIQNNCFVALAMADRKVESNEKYETWIQNCSLDDLGKPFKLAAAGLYYFTNDQIELGRANYFAAMEAASEGKDAGLLVMAIVYWLNQELKHNQFSPSEALQIVDLLESKLSRNPRTLNKVKLVLGSFKTRLSIFEVHSFVQKSADYQAAPERVSKLFDDATSRETS